METRKACDNLLFFVKYLRQRNLRMNKYSLECLRKVNKRTIVKYFVKMGDKLKELRERSQRRRQLLVQQASICT